MIERLHLSPRHCEEIEALLHKHLPDVEVWAYGSRVNGRSHDGSDLDLVLRGPKLAEIDTSRIVDFIEALQDSTIPFLVEARDWARLPESFHREIERAHAVLAVAALGEALEGRNVGVTDEWRATTIGGLLAADGGSVKTGPFGTALKAKEYSKVGVPLISVGEVGYGSLRLHAKTPRAPREVVERLPEYLLEAGDIVFGRKGAVDRSALVKPNQAGWFLGSDGIRLRLPTTCDSRFIAYQLQGEASRLWLLHHATGTTMASLNQEIIERVPIVLPPIEQQRVIAHILGTLDDKIELNRRINETLEAVARALFKSWFVDFDPVRAKMAGRDPGLPPHLADLFPDRFEESELGKIPEGWEVKTLGDLLELAYGKALRADSRHDGDVPVYGSNGEVGWHNKRLVQGPGIVVGRKGNPGVITWAAIDFFPIDTTFYVVPKDSNQNLYFLFYALKGQDLPSIAADSAVPGLNRNLAYMNKQVMPVDRIVEHFNAYVDPIFDRSHCLAAESRILAFLRDVLLPKLISGEIRLRDGDKQA